MMRKMGVALVLGSIFLASCGKGAPEEPNPLAAPPVALELSTEEALGWEYQRERQADLDGDGSPETVILVSDVEVSAIGTPLWEDGHRWAVLVRDGEHQTFLFSAFVPNGFAEAAILQAANDGMREILVQQRSPGELRTFTIRYEGDGRARAGSSAYYQIEEWLPGSARLME